MRSAIEKLELKIRDVEQERGSSNDEFVFFGAVFSDWIDSRVITALRTLLFTRCLCKIAQKAGLVARLALSMPAEFDILPGCAEIYQSWQDDLNVLPSWLADHGPMRSTQFSSLVTLLYEHVKKGEVLVLVYPEFWSASASELRSSLENRNISVVFFAVGKVQVSCSEFVSVTDYIKIRLQQVEQLQERRRGCRVTEREATAVRLCTCVIAFELLLPSARKRISVHLNPTCDLPERCKRGIFVMYNYARTDSILRQFSSGLFPQLPELSTLPTECFQNDEEFAGLIANILRRQPFAEDLMRRQLDNTNSNRSLTEPRLCLQLAEFSNTFSKVYSKIQVLPPRSDMVTPRVFLRIHILRIINRWMLHMFKLLSLEEIADM